MTTTATALEQLRRRVRTEHAIRVRTILDLAAADALDTADGMSDQRTALLDALALFRIEAPPRYVPARFASALDGYAEDLVDLDTRRRYLETNGPDAVDAYLSEEELAHALRYHRGDKGALFDAMLAEVLDGLDALIGESAPAPVPALG